MEAVLLGCLLLFCLFHHAITQRSTIYDVTKFGAKGDGKSDDSKKFLEAWGHACGDPFLPTLVIPSGKSFMLTETNFTGPCKSNIRLQIEGEIVAPSKWWRDPSTKWISFMHVSNLAIDGKGRINGKGDSWWTCFNKERCDERPDAVGLFWCDNAKVRGVTFVNAPQKHLTISHSNNVLIDGISISAPGGSPNTDGIHVQKSNHVSVNNCNIGTGDDCIAVGTASVDVHVTNMKCGPGHGISIGSLGRDKAYETVEKISISNCSLTNTTNGLRIKTWQGGSGYVKDVTVEDVVINDVKNPIFLHQYYCPHMRCKNRTSAVEIGDVRFTRIAGTAIGDFGIRLECSESVACTGIILKDIKIRPADPAEELVNYCLNAKGETNGNVVPEMTCLR